MLHIEDAQIRKLLLTGNFGLEKESLRVDENGYLSQTRHPFPDDDHIVRDFCENQTEVNTPVTHSPTEAVASLAHYHQKIQQGLSKLTPKEYLWPFSNPPYIRNEEDVPIAIFEGGRASKTEYREYLSDRYGRYKMTFSGIHFNFSFSEELLQRGFSLSGGQDYTEYKNQLYVDLAQRAVVYGWLMVAVTAASPLLDSSFVEKGKFGQDCFSGMASVRCSEMGYWNYFVPILDYTDIRTYADSIQKYVDNGLLRAPSELYYPIRLKPKGKNVLGVLREQGVDHIELRMIDVNPLTSCGVDERDVAFAQLLLAWLAATPGQPLSHKDQVQAVQNFKSAARYDLKTVKIVMPDGQAISVTDAALQVLECMREFYRDFPAEVQAVLNFETEKFLDADKRYAWIVRKEYSDGYVRKGLELAKKRQEELNV